MNFPDRCKHTVKYTWGKKSKYGSVKELIHENATYDELTPEAKEWADENHKQEGFQCKEDCPQ